MSIFRQKIESFLWDVSAFKESHHKCQYYVENYSNTEEGLIRVEIVCKHCARYGVIFVEPRYELEVNRSFDWETILRIPKRDTMNYKEYKEIFQPFFDKFVRANLNEDELFKENLDQEPAPVNDCAYGNHPVDDLENSHRSEMGDERDVDYYYTEDLQREAVKSISDEELKYHTQTAIGNEIEDVNRKVDNSIDMLQKFIKNIEAYSEYYKHVGNLAKCNCELCREKTDSSKWDVEKQDDENRDQDGDSELPAPFYKIKDLDSEEWNSYMNGDLEDYYYSMTRIFQILKINRRLNEEYNHGYLIDVSDPRQDVYTAQITVNILSMLERLLSVAIFDKKIMNFTKFDKCVGNNLKNQDLFASGLKYFATLSPEISSNSININFLTFAKYFINMDEEFSGKVPSRIKKYISIKKYIFESVIIPFIVENIRNIHDDWLLEERNNSHNSYKSPSYITPVFVLALADYCFGDIIRDGSFICDIENTDWGNYLKIYDITVSDPYNSVLRRRFFESIRKNIRTCKSNNVMKYICDKYAEKMLERAKDVMLSKDDIDKLSNDIYDLFPYTVLELLFLSSNVAVDEYDKNYIVIRHDEVIENNSTGMEPKLDSSIVESRIILPDKAILTYITTEGDELNEQNNEE